MRQTISQVKLLMAKTISEIVFPNHILLRIICGGCIRVAIKIFLKNYNINLFLLLTRVRFALKIHIYYGIEAHAMIILDFKMDNVK